MEFMAWPVCIYPCLINQTACIKPKKICTSTQRHPFCRLPGESQQIDRIMEAFAQRYCEQNPRLFEERDTCYILCFSIIMLNTMLHNPNVRTRPNVEGFVSQNRGINSGKDLPRPMLVSKHCN